MPPEFRTLDVAIEFAQLCQRVKAPPNLKYQLGKASSSIALNLAEGSAKDSKRDRHRFYQIALGSFRETEAILKILNNQQIDVQVLKDRVGGQLVRLCASTR